VAPIGDSVLLGCDIIDEKDITINSKRRLQLGGQWICCETERCTDGVARVDDQRNFHSSRLHPINNDILFQYLIRYDFLLYVSRYILTHLFDITLLE
jgi:hypothetical protein